MAPAPEGKPRRKAFSLANPGAREYLTVGIGALALFLAWDWLKNRQAAAAAPATAADAAATTPTGLSTGDFWDWISDHSSSSTTTSKAATVTVPNVVGMDLTPGAASVLHQAGLKIIKAEPDVGKITRQNPAAGTKARKGSAVTVWGRGAKPAAAPPAPAAAPAKAA